MTVVQYGRIVPGSADACVRHVSATARGICIMRERGFRLILHHTRTHAAHHSLVRFRAYSAHISQYLNLPGRLDHSTVKREKNYEYHPQRQIPCFFFSLFFFFLSRDVYFVRYTECLAAFSAALSKNRGQLHLVQSRDRGRTHAQRRSQGIFDRVQALRQVRHQRTVLIRELRQSRIIQTRDSKAQFPHLPLPHHLRPYQTPAVPAIMLG